jgi:hypothetical protein
MYFDALKATWERYRAEPTKPASPEQIAALEQELNLTFPVVVREFLGWLGNGPGITYNAFPASVVGVQAEAHQMVQNGGGTEQLPADAFFFRRCNCHVPAGVLH